ncbi:CoA-binding domain protein [Citreicella sp. SE45]|uniref:hypothetical protein n=1 Tax=Salipiger sp. HF18 TaxID=2721557 RepID=UPI0001B8C558|nr:hypothetical protein [Salipiger sp. HF18]EEX12163.1 CoA-binding domain protein [Citreicella sp. SE45]NIY95309.1 hypothetical protein [Salipiger sp. HF18]
MKEVVSRLIADPETGALLVTIGSSAQFNPELAVTPIIDAEAEINPLLVRPEGQGIVLLDALIRRQ